MSRAELLRDGDLGILRIDNPPFNALSPGLVADLDRAFAAFEADGALVALPLEYAGRTFVCGGDIAAFEDPEFSGFPAWRGGPLFMADEIGLERIVTRLDHYASVLGNDYGYRTVAPLLRRLAERGERLSDWQRDT